MSVRVNVNGSLRGRAEAAAQKASEAAMRELFAAFQQSFTAKAWAWPGTTERRVGTAGSPRNIIDIGNLRQTGYYEFLTPYSVRFTWSAVYARLVHEGGSIRPWGNKRASPVRIPARPWTAAVIGRVRVPGIEPFPFQKRMRDVWVAYFKRAGR